MAEVGTYYITIMPSMSKFTSGVNKALSGAGADGGNSYSKSFLSVVKGSALGSALGGLASQAGGAIADGFSSGVQRLDTIKNYPKVMENLGYSTQDADRSIKTITEHLDGLPTSTDEMVRLTQSIADSTGDLDLATKASLGFNDMLLATGASTADVTNATDMLNRILGKGSATTNQWYSLQQYIPAQLNSIAEHMLGTGKSSEDLKTALEDGTVSWNDFLQAIVDLDENGTEHTASFEEQARSMTGGIGTAIENVGNRISKGWAAILESIGQSEISSTIDKMSTGIKTGMEKIAEGVGYVADRVKDSNIADSLGKIADNVGKFLEKVTNSGALKDFADKMVDLIDGALKFIADHGDAVATALVAIGTAIVVKQGADTILGMVDSFKLLGEYLPLIEGFADIGPVFTMVGEAGGPLAGMFSGLGGAFSSLAAGPIPIIIAAVAALVAGLVFFFTQTEEGQRIWADFTAAVGELWAGLQEDFGVLCEVLSQEWQSFQDFLNGIPEWWNGICESWKQYQEGVREWWDKAWNDAKESVLNVWNGIREGIGNALTAIKDTISRIVTSIKTTVTNVFNGIKTTVGNIVNGIKTNVTSTFDGIKTNVTNIIEGIKTKATEIFTSIRDKVGEIVNGIKDTVTSTFDTAKETVTNIFNDIKDGIVNAFNDAKDTATGIIDGIKDTISNTFGDAKDTALGIFDDIKDGIADKIQWAYDTISGIIDNITGLFDFEWEFPAPSLPHIEWHWEDLGGIVSYPVFDGIEWYAKGGVFDAATIIGVGEHGREAALPLNAKTYGEIAEGIADKLGGSGDVTIIKGNTFYVREEADIDRVSEAIARKVSRERAGRL